MASSLPTLLPRPRLAGNELLDELRRLAHTALTVAKSADFDLQTPAGAELLSHIAPDFQARLDNVPGALSFRQLIDTWRSYATQDSNLGFAEASVNADVDEEEGRATTYMCVDASCALQATVAVSTLTACKWRREADGKWVIYDFHGMRSTKTAHY